MGDFSLYNSQINQLTTHYSLQAGVFLPINYSQINELTIRLSLDYIRPACLSKKKYS